MTPALDLLGEVAYRLPAERRIARADAFGGFAVALRARWQAARGISLMVEPARRRGRGCGLGLVAHLGVIGRHRVPALGRKAPGDPLHFGVVAAAYMALFQAPLVVPTP